MFQRVGIRMDPEDTEQPERLGAVRCVPLCVWVNDVNVWNSPRGTGTNELPEMIEMEAAFEHVDGSKHPSLRMTD